MKALYISIGVFGWSVWEFYDGNHSMAYFLIATSVYVLLVGGFVFTFANNIMLDQISINLFHIKAPINSIQFDLSDIIRQKMTLQDGVRTLHKASNSLTRIEHDLKEMSTNSRVAKYDLDSISHSANIISNQLDTIKQSMSDILLKD